MNQPHICFIGGGNMAAGMLGGLLNADWPAAALSASDPDDERRAMLEERFGITCFADNTSCAARGDVVVLAVKPQFLRAAVESVGAVLQKQKPLLISIAAGIRCADVLRWAGGESESASASALALVRAMPNTPALVNAGISGLFATAQVDAAQRELAQRILRSVGETLWVEDEALLDVVTAVSGSGPAYFFKLMEILAQSATENGMDADAANALAVHTALGAATLAMGSDGGDNKLSPAQLRRQVTSPGGTTEAALAAMDAHGMNEAVRHGVAAAIRRAEQLADEFGNHSEDD